MLQDDAIEADIAAQLQRAREHGFLEERDCARWVLCAWCLGKDFDHKIPSLAEMLKREDVAASYEWLHCLERILGTRIAQGSDNYSAIGVWLGDAGYFLHTIPL